MKDESLDKALNAFYKTLDKLDIDVADKVELLINLKHFLDPLRYRDNITVLSNEQRRRQR